LNLSFLEDQVNQGDQEDPKPRRRKERERECCKDRQREGVKGKRKEILGMLMASNNM